MKRWSLFLPLCLVLFVFAACDKEEMDITVEEPVVEETTPTDGARMDIDPQLFAPDLIITRIQTNLPNTGPCAIPIGAPQLPNATCTVPGGSNQFVMTLRITNRGPAAVPAGVPFTIAYDLDIPGPQALETVPNPTGIAAGASIIVTKNLSYPCATFGPPYGLVTRNTVMTVDVFNNVAETDETNNSNANRPYRICDDI